MTIVLPKELKGFRFPQAIPFEMNDFHIETIWPQVFRLAVLDGRDSSRGSSEQADIASSVRSLTSHDRVMGFNNPSAQLLADKIVRSSLVRTARTLKTKVIQIDSLIPYSITSFKAGFPTNAAGFRQVDRFLFELFLENLKGDPTEVRRFFVDVFGAGVQVKGFPTPSVNRKPGEFPDLDVITELSIDFIDHFDMSQPKRVSLSYRFADPLPKFQMALGVDLHRFVCSYRDKLSAPTLIEQLTALLGFELLVWSSKVFVALPALAATPDFLPPAMDVGHFAVTLPEIFVDMTQQGKTLSRAMSVACIARDQQMIDPFVRAVLRLRYIDSIVEKMKRNPSLNKRLDEVDGSETTSMKLRFFAMLPEDIQFEARFEAEIGTDLDRIVSMNRGAADPEEGAPMTEVDTLLKRLQREQRSLLDQLVEVLFIAQATKIRQSQIGGWIRMVSGVGTPWGLINGLSDRRSWSYAPGNDLLMVLVQLCAIDRPDWDADTNSSPQRFGLQHFLDWLERRFGILVDRPPADLGFDSPEHMAAARENLQAMLRRLRQMGIFEDRSDDFSVQKLTPPFMDQA